MSYFDRYQGWLHVLGWAVFISLPILTLPDFFLNQLDLISIGMAQLFTSVLIISFFYINLHSLTPALLRDQNIQRFILLMVGMLVSVAAVRVGCYFLFPPASMTQMPLEMPPPPGNFGPGRPPGPGPPHSPGPHSPWPSALGSTFSLGFALMVSSLIALFRNHSQSQENQQRMMLEKVSAELSMLKLQVSPHFLFNTLNNIRWLARKKSEQTEAAVVTLAQLLRYMIYQAQQDRVPLRQEVQHLQDYIDLQKMRLAANNTVTFHCEGEIDAYQIEPLLFIPFVENAFKYGIHGQQTGHIRISLAVSDERLIFCAENPTAVPTAAQPNRSSPTDAGQQFGGSTPTENRNSGIGIANVQKRLALHYPDQHDLQFTGENNIFRVVLTLHLHHDQVALHRH